MSKIVQFDSSEGPVLIEVADDALPSTEQFAAVEPGIAAKARKSFEDALDAAKPGIDAALRCLSNMAAQETVIEFGLKLDAAAGAVFARAGAEATFKVKLTWKK